MTHPFTEDRRGSGTRAAGRAGALFLGAALLWHVLPLPAAAAPADYPTEVLAEYVLGCMAANGQTPEILRRCSCSIDYIAGRLPYDQYVEAETVLRMRQEKSGKDQFVMFRSSTWAQEMVDRLRRVQVEADRKCF